MTTFLKKYGILSFIFLFLTFCIPTMHAMKKKEQEIILRSKDGVSFQIKRKFAKQSILLRDILEEEDDENENEEIPLPSIEAQYLKTIIQLLEQSHTSKQNKEVIANFIIAPYINWIKKSLKKSQDDTYTKQPPLNLRKLIAYLKGANYLNAQPVLKAVAYVIAKLSNKNNHYKITKDILENLPYELLFEIQAQWILQFRAYPIGLFEKTIIDDLKESSNYQPLINALNKEEFAAISYENGTITLLKTNIGSISRYIKNFNQWTSLAYVDADKNIIVHDLQTGRIQRSFKIESPIISFALSSNGKKLATFQRMYENESEQIIIENTTLGSSNDTFIGNKNEEVRRRTMPLGGNIFGGITPRSRPLNDPILEIPLDEHINGDSTTLEIKENMQTFEDLPNSHFLVCPPPIKPPTIEVDSGAIRELVFLTGAGKPLEQLEQNVKLLPEDRIPEACAEKNIKIWDVKTGKEILTIKSPSIQGFKLSSNGEKFAIRTHTELVVWDLQTKKVILTTDVGLISRDRDFKLSHNGEKLAVKIDKKLVVWNLQTKKAILTTDVDLISMDCDFKLSPDGKKLAVQKGKKLTVWDLQTQKVILTTDVDDSWVFTIRGLIRCEFGFSPNGEKLAIKNVTKFVVWDLQTKKVILTIDVGTLVGKPFAFGPDGEKLAIKDGTKFVVWDLQTQKVILTTDVYSLSDKPLAFSPDGKKLAVEEGRKLAVWDLQTQKKTMTIDSKAKIKSFTFTPFVYKPH